jgi:hypothetical protein
MIQQIEDHYNGVTYKENYLVSGMRVKIIKGILAGRAGILMTSPKGKQVAIEIENMGHSLLLNVPTADLLVL